MYQSDKELLAEMVRLRKYERDAMIELLDTLQEVYDRRLFADLGYGSIIKYLVKELGYSESAAFRRYQALRLTIEIPEAKAMLEKGEVNVTSASMIMGGLKNSEDKLKVLKDSVNKTTSETQEMIVRLNPEVKKKDIINPVREGESRAHLTLSKDTLEKLERFKGLVGDSSTDQAINRALTSAIEEFEKRQQKINKVKVLAKKTVPRSTVKKVKIRAKNTCEYPNCNEVFGLEIDHIHPRAKGGGDEIENLRLYCKTHNQRAAIIEFGKDKMNKYLK